VQQKHVFIDLPGSGLKPEPFECPLFCM